jgi:hypothetical protein
VKRIMFEAVLFTLASPWILLEAMVRFWRRIRFWRTAYATVLQCRVCESAIALVGAWRCSCGYTYRGHVLRVCPVCRSLPRMARCYACGSTERLPEQ